MHCPQLLPRSGNNTNSKRGLSFTRILGLPDPPKPSAHVRSPLFRGLRNIKDAVAKLGDGKLKTHAIRLPKNLDSLKGFAKCCPKNEYQCKAAPPQQAVGIFMIWSPTLPAPKVRIRRSPRRDKGRLMR
jgi:hypothetical protein